MDEHSDALRQGLLCLLEETLHSHQGVYTEAGTSLIETLQAIDASHASRGLAGAKETIAGHANHARYYLANTLDMLQGRGNGDFNVAESWKVTTVTADQWDSVRAELLGTYQQVMRHVSTAPAAELEATLPALMGMVAHSAYHLGALRQLLEHSNKTA